MNHRMNHRMRRYFFIGMCVFACTCMMLPQCKGLQLDKVKHKKEEPLQTAKEAYKDLSNRVLVTQPSQSVLIDMTKFRDWTKTQTDDGSELKWEKEIYPHIDQYVYIMKKENPEALFLVSNALVGVLQKQFEGDPDAVKNLLTSLAIAAKQNRGAYNKAVEAFQASEGEQALAPILDLASTYREQAFSEENYYLQTLR